MFVCLFVCSVLTIVSCEKPSKTAVEDYAVLRADWINAKLDGEFAKSQQKVSAYLFKPEHLQDIANNSNATSIRLVMSYQESQILFNAVAVDKNGKELKSCASEMLKDDSFGNKLLILKNSQSTITSANKLLSDHILNANTSYEYIQKWKKELKIANNLNELTSYDGNRIHHFSIDLMVIKDLLNIQQISKMGLTIGINPENKITTVLYALDGNNSVIIPTAVGNFETSGGVIYDFTRPCPKACDPISRI